MTTQARRKTGLVLFLVGLIIAVAAYLITDGQLTGYSGNTIAFVALIVGGGLALSGLVSMLLPKHPVERRFEKIDQLEKRVAQLERERKNTP